MLAHFLKEAVSSFYKLPVCRISHSSHISGPSCSKLTMLLVNVLLKLWSLNMAYMQTFLLKNTSESDIVLTRTVNILTTNELIRLMMLWTTWPRCFTRFNVSFKENFQPSRHIFHEIFVYFLLGQQILQFLLSYQDFVSQRLQIQTSCRRHREADLDICHIYEGKSISNQPIPFPIDRDTQDFHALFQYMF